ncbi:hypothetical protein EGW08_010345 [Elysia chlorotica]|uniref:Uncharacterized protein n=1 Tax=Elysia chlorotica TaxID=188477 RepID=A0A433TK45_ELYCH|nr:hypothetical protein EGW08_010345 [Elysia chlorotica]
MFFNPTLYRLRLLATIWFRTTDLLRRKPMFYPRTTELPSMSGVLISFSGEINHPPHIQPLQASNHGPPASEAYALPQDHRASFHCLDSAWSIMTTEVYKLEAVYQFTYLDSIITDNLSLDNDINERIGKATEPARLTIAVWTHPRATEAISLSVVLISFSGGINHPPHISRLRTMDLLPRKPEFYPKTTAPPLNNWSAH